MTAALELGGPDFVAAALVLFVASAVRGYSGFGFSAVLVAGLSFFIDPIEAVSLAIGLEVLASVVQAPSVWGDVEWRRFGVLLVSALVGNPLGVWALTTIEADTLRAATLVLLAALTTALLLGWRVEVDPSLVVFFGVGLVAGVVNGATAMSGLVLVLAMTSLDVTPSEMRGTLVAYFFASDLAVMGLLYQGGELDATYAWRIVASIPLMIAGVLLGTRAFRGASVAQFRRVTLVLLLAVSLVGLARLAIL